MIVQKTHRIKLNPTKEQIDLFLLQCAAVRLAYNWALARWNELYEANRADPEQPKPSLTAIKRQFNAWKKQKILNEVENGVPEGEFSILWIQDVIQGRATEWGIDQGLLKTGFSVFFDTLKGKRPKPAGRKPRKDGKPKAHPRFKSRFDPQQSFMLAGSDLRFNEYDIRVPKFGWVNGAEKLRFKRKKEIETAWRAKGINPEELDENDKKEGKIGNCVISTKNGGRTWFISIPVAVRVEPAAKTGSIKGVELGLRTLAVVYDGSSKEERLHFPNYSQRSKQKLAQLQRKLARQEKGSNRWEKTKKRIQDVHLKIANQRDWSTHQLTNSVVTSADTVVMRDLSIQKMSARKPGEGKKGRHINAAISNANWYQTRQQIAYKMQWRDGRFVILESDSPTSRTCSQCGHETHQTSDLTITIWICESCQHPNERELNAAKNIRNWGIQQLIDSGDLNG